MWIFNACSGCDDDEGGGADTGQVVDTGADTTTGEDTGSDTALPPDTTEDDTAVADTAVDDDTAMADTAMDDTADMDTAIDDTNMDDTNPIDTTPDDTSMATGPQIEVAKADDCASLGTPTTEDLPWSDADDNTNYTNSFSYHAGACNDQVTPTEYGLGSPDVLYAITALEDGALVIDLETTVDLALTVTGVCGDSLNSCVAESDLVGDVTVETATFDVTAGTTYYVQVDGWENDAVVAGSYTLNVNLAENCSDGIDNNGDNAADCQDLACADAPNCDEGNTDLYPDGCLPGDGVDNDDDGLFDCADPDCAGVAECDEGDTTLYPTGCDPLDTNDDDQDGLLNCADPDCDGAAACNEGDDTLYPGGCNPLDAADDDLDGLLNCADPDCADEPACNEADDGLYANGCLNGTDDDLDGDSDCDDSDCQANPACLGPGDSCDQPLPLIAEAAPATFDSCNYVDVVKATGESNGCQSNSTTSTGQDVWFEFVAPAPGPYVVTVDGTFDSVVNAFDATTACPAAGDYDACIDGSDAGSVETVQFTATAANESFIIVVDGWSTACGSFDISAMAVPPEDCTDGTDNDLDGDADCDDSDCQNLVACNEFAGGAGACSDGADNDNDGDTDCDDLDCKIGDPITCPPEPGDSCVDPLIAAAVPYNVSVDTCDFFDLAKATAETNGCQSNLSSSTGGDVFIEFTAPAAGPYFVDVDDSFDSIVNVIDGNVGCPTGDYDMCIDGGDTPPTAAFTAAAAGDVFYVVVDGWSTGCGTADIEIVSVPPEDCTDDTDNDFDGDTDCDDSDCASTPLCNEFANGATACTDGLDNDNDGSVDCADIDCKLGDPVTCPPDPGDSCADAIPATAVPFLHSFNNCLMTDTANATGEANGCEANSTTSTGNDIFVEFTAPAAGDYLITFDDVGWDGIFNVIAGTQGCPTGDYDVCIDGKDFDPLTVQVTAAAGEVFFIVGDTWGAGTTCGDGSISIVAVTADEVGLCDDGGDNDNDGDIDCDDSDCAGAAVCDESSTPGWCTDGLDNDNDGDIDCLDLDCITNDPVSCPLPPGDTCSDPIIATALPFTETINTCLLTDAVSATDEAAGCQSNSTTSTGQDAIIEFTAPSTGNFLATAGAGGWDSIINVIAGTEGCPTAPYGICVDGDDSGGDEAVVFAANAGDVFYIVVDGWSTACGSTDFSIVEVAVDEVGMCLDSLDNDADGDVDCDDSDCFTEPSCDESTFANGCTDGTDNDGDGDVDCDDSNCDAEPSCDESTFVNGCTDGLDNDGDGDVDCDDPNCATEPACDESTYLNGCSDTIDNDGDGDVDCDDPQCQANDPLACPAPVGNSCNDPFVASAVPYATSADSCTFFNTFVATSEAGGCESNSSTSASEDFIVQFIAPAAGTYEATITPDTWDSILNIVADSDGGCPISGMVTTCVDSDDEFTGGATETGQFTATAAGEVFYVIVDGWGTVCGPVDVTIDLAP